MFFCLGSQIITYSLEVVDGHIPISSFMTESKHS